MPKLRHENECHARPSEHYEPARGRVHVDMILGAGSAQGPVSQVMGPARKELRGWLGILLSEALTLTTSERGTAVNQNMSPEVHVTVTGVLSRAYTVSTLPLGESTLERPHLSS